MSGLYVINAHLSSEAHKTYCPATDADLRAAGWVPAGEVHPLVEAVRYVMGANGNDGHETFHGQGGRVSVRLGGFLRRAESALAAGPESSRNAGGSEQ